MNEFLKIIVFLSVTIIIIYMISLFFPHQKKSVFEGLTNPDGTITSSASGEAGTAASYAAAIKAQTVKIQDELLISKYRKDYETAIINLDDYAGMLMIKQILNMKLDADPKAVIEALNGVTMLKDARESLNIAMKFLDSQ